MARPCTPFSSVSSTSTVGLPRESRISRATSSRMGARVIIYMQPPVAGAVVRQFRTGGNDLPFSVYYTVSPGALQAPLSPANLAPACVSRPPGGYPYHHTTANQAQRYVTFPSGRGQRNTVRQA